MAIRKEETEVCRTGTICLADQAILQYVVTHSGLRLITEESILAYLEIESAKELSGYRILPDRVRVAYRNADNNIQAGLAITAVPAFCLSLIEANSQFNKWPLAAMNASMLLTMLCSMQLNELIENNPIIHTKHSLSQKMMVRWKKT